ncbi:MAG: endonuclease V [Candidatus Nanosalina sp.]
MEPVNRSFVPDPSLEREEMEEMQRKIARKAVFEDDFDFSSDDQLTVVGIDQAFLDVENSDSPGEENQRFSKAVSAAVVMENDEVVEKVHGVADLEIPYIPGLLAFREGECIVNALEKLESDPDLLVLDGSGRIHFRQAGIATHIGVIFDVPSIGVTKNLLCGELQAPVDELEEGEKVEIYTDSEVENLDSGVIGHAFQSRQYENSRSINPLYVSPGHRVSCGTAVELVERFCEGYKLPEPTRRADNEVAEVKKEIQEN